MVARATLLFALLGGALLALFGCGQQMPLPPAPPEGGQDLVVPGTYNLRGTWPLSGPGDVAVNGLYLFVIEEGKRVDAYYAKQLSPRTPSMIAPFTDLVAPVQLAVAKRDSLFVIVADAGDMSCKIYYWLGGPPLATFHDTLWVSFTGLAADGNLNIFVADAARDTIQAYDRWGHPLRVVSDYGTGGGYVIDPHGLAHNGDVLIVADTGKNWVQRLEPDTTNVAALSPPIGVDEILLQPEDVAVDRNGEFIYVADTGHDRVLKFLTTGAFQDTVAAPQKIDLTPPFRAPRYLCAEDSLVFVSDSVSNRIVVLELKPL